MNASIDVITLAVDDLERALSFYRALGLESGGVVATEWQAANALRYLREHGEEPDWWERGAPRRARSP